MRKKVTVVGGGFVGSTTAQRIHDADLADVVLTDILEGVPAGKALDMAESAPILGSNSHAAGISTASGDYKETANSDVIIITAGFPRKPGMSRDDLLKANYDVMKAVVEKAAATGNEQLMVTERGFAFGYQNLIADMRSLAVMAEFGYPVIYDAGHSVQQPGGLGTASGGQRQFIRPLARAAVAVGVDAIFLEAHEDPDHALSDGPNSYRLSEMEELLRELKRIDEAVSAR